MNRYITKTEYSKPAYENHFQITFMYRAHMILHAMRGRTAEKLDRIADESTTTRRAFLGAAGGLGLTAFGGTAGAWSSETRYITVSNRYDRKTPYRIEVTGTLERSTKYNATIDDHDTIDDDTMSATGRGVSGHVWNGRDTYAFTGEINQLGASEPLRVEINGQKTDASTFLRKTVTIVAPPDSFAEYALSFDNYYLAVEGYGATVDPNDDQRSWTAYGQVGLNGRDSWATGARVRNLSLSGENPEGVTVLLNGEPVDPDRFSPGSGALWIADLNAVAGDEDLDNEYVTLENVSGESVSLGGYAVYYGYDESYTFSSIDERVLDAGETITVRTNDGDQAQSDDVIAFSDRDRGVLNNEDGSIYVLDPGGGTIVDVDYTVNSNGETVLLD